MLRHLDPPHTHVAMITAVQPWDLGLTHTYSNAQKPQDCHAQQLLLRVNPARPERVRRGEGVRPLTFTTSQKLGIWDVLQLTIWSSQWWHSCYINLSDLATMLALALSQHTVMSSQLGLLGDSNAGIARFVCRRAPHRKKPAVYRETNGTLSWVFLQRPGFLAVQQAWCSSQNSCPWITPCCQTGGKLCHFSPRVDFCVRKSF